MNLVRRKSASWFAAVALSAGLCGSASAQSPLGPEWEQFLKEKVSFGGFIENVTGLSDKSWEPFFQHLEPLGHAAVHFPARVQR